jgi:esterase/lipase superfamily enzyme
MYREEITQFSQPLNREMHVLIHGYAGMPLLCFPTQDSPCRNYEEFGMTQQLADFIDDGRIQLFVVDTVDKESWSDTFGDNEHRTWIQEMYYHYIIEEVCSR